MQALQSQLDFQEQSMVEKSLVSRQDAKIRELETKLEFEKTQVKRLEVRADAGGWRLGEIEAGLACGRCGEAEVRSGENNKKHHSFIKLQQDMMSQNVQCNTLLLPLREKFTNLLD